MVIIKLKNPAEYRYVDYLSARGIDDGLCRTGKHRHAFFITMTLQHGVRSGTAMPEALAFAQHLFSYLTNCSTSIYAFQCLFYSPKTIQLGFWWDLIECLNHIV